MLLLDVLIIAPSPFGKTCFTIFINLFLSFSSSILCDTVIKFVFGIKTTNLPGKFMCVETLAPLDSVPSLFTCTNIFVPAFIISVISFSFILLFISVFVSSSLGNKSFKRINVFLLSPISIKADCIPCSTLCTLPQYIFPSSL